MTNTQSFHSSSFEDNMGHQPVLEINLWHSRGTSWTAIQRNELRYGLLSLHVKKVQSSLCTLMNHVEQWSMKWIVKS